MKFKVKNEKKMLKRCNFLKIQLISILFTKFYASYIKTLVFNKNTKENFSVSGIYPNFDAYF